MANNQNLAPPFGTEGAYIPTHEDCVKGGEASGPARKYNNEWKRKTRAFLLKQTGEDANGEPLTNMDDMLEFAAEHFKKTGNAELLKFFRDTVGEKPTDKTEIEQKTVRIRLTRHSAEETEKEPDDDDEC